MKNLQLGKLLTSLVILLCLFLTLSKVTSLELRLWDEGRNAVNALEMAQEGFSIVTTYDWNPEHWNTKPPFLIWIQALFFKIFGLTILAVRLPSILAALAFIPIFISLGKRWEFGRIFSLSSIVVLFTMPLFLFVHTFRTGDYDGLLTLLMFSYSIFYLLFLDYEKKKSLWLFFLFLFLAVMTKGIAGLLFLPGLFLLTIFRKKLKFILTTRDVYFGITAVVVSVFLYYFVRNLMDPEYWENVVLNELGGRFLDSADKHYQPIGFYFWHLREIGMKWYYYAFPFFALMAFLGSRTRKYAIFCLLIILSHLAIMTISQTKVYWYILPIIPFVALIFGLGYSTLFLFLQQRIKHWNVIHFCCFLLLAFPIYEKIQSVSNTRNLLEEQKDYYISRFLIENMEDAKILENTNIMVAGHITSVRFYVEQYEKKGGVIYIRHISQIKPGDKVLISDEQLKKDLAAKFELELLINQYGASLYKILD